MSAATEAGPQPVPIRTSFLGKVFTGFAVLAALSVALSLAGRWFGAEIALGGHTDSQALREIVIGNNVLVVPENMIRLEKARRDGVAARLDLYVRWPEMDGYSAEAKDVFNNVGGPPRVLFLGFEEPMMSRDMSGRLEPIYEALIEKPGTPGPGGTIIYDFSPKSGYLNEQLVVARQPGRVPFVARCLTGPGAEQTLAPCERDARVGDDLSLTYRFPQHLLADWHALDASVRALARKLIRPAL
jgi:hypothetical protein